MRHRIAAVGGIPGGLIAGGVAVSLLMFASAASDAQRLRADPVTTPR